MQPSDGLEEVGRSVERPNPELVSTAVTPRGDARIGRVLDRLQHGRCRGHHGERDREEQRRQ
jgi:hypothetical protein